MGKNSKVEEGKVLTIDLRISCIQCNFLQQEFLLSKLYIFQGKIFLQNLLKLRKVKTTAIYTFAKAMTIKDNKL